MSDRTQPDGSSHTAHAHALVGDAERLHLLDEAVGITREGIVITDSQAPDEPIIYVNRGFERITGYGYEEVLGRNCRFLQGADTDPAEVDKIRQALRDATPVTVELLNVRKDGSEFWNLVSITPIVDAAGLVTHRVGVQLDVTDRKRAQDALRTARDQLEQRVAERTEDLQQANLALREEVQARRQTQERLIEQQKRLRSLANQLSNAEQRERRRIAGELHDRVSQGLVALKVQLEILGQADGADVADMLDALDELVEQTRSMTFDLCPPMLYDLGLVAAVEELTARTGRDAGLQAEFVDDGRPKPVEPELRGFLYRATRELLLNVTKHAKASSVVVSMDRSPQTLAISVQDDGRGVQRSQEASPRKTEGGFGLFSIRERLGQLGGWLLEESKPDQGTRMTLFVPLTDADTSREDTSTDGDANHTGG